MNEFEILSFLNTLWIVLFMLFMYPKIKRLLQ